MSTAHARNASCNHIYPVGICNRIDFCDHIARVQRTSQGKTAAINVQHRENQSMRSHNFLYMRCPTWRSRLTHLD